MSSRIGFRRDERLALHHQAYSASLCKIVSRQTSPSSPSSNVYTAPLQRFERLEATTTPAYRDCGSPVASQIGELAQTLGLSHTLTETTSQKSIEATNVLGEKIDSLSELSKGQFQDILHLLRRMQKTTMSLHNNRATISDCQGVGFESEIPVIARVRDDALIYSMKRLCDLKSNILQSCLSSEAFTAIEDLETILDAILRTSHYPNAKESRKSQDHTDEHHSGSEFNLDFDRQCWCATKRFRGLISASQSLEIEGPNSSRLRLSTTEKPSNFIAKGKSYELDGATVSVSFSKCTQVRHKPQELPGSHSTSASELFEATISVLPVENPQKTKVSVSIVQQATTRGCKIRNPYVTFWSVVSDESAVLEAVRTGDFSGLIGLLEANEASMTDCDSEGRSLLNVSGACSTLLKHNVMSKW